MTDERDEDSGKFTEQYSSEDFLQAVDKIENATTAQVAEEVGCSYDLAYRRLTTLKENEEITGIKVGPAFVWSR